MEAVMIDTLVEGNTIKVPKKFWNKRVKVIIFDPDEEKVKPVAQKINFAIDENLEDVTPFSDIDDSKEFSRKLRETHWQ